MGATIECRVNGPYLVKECGNLRDANGERVATEAVYALCRCGGSANKPFCDGTHKRNGFSGDRVSDGSNDKLEKYGGRGITILDNRSICAHAGHCTDGLADVFKYGSEPWIDPNGAEAAAIVATVNNCPSGALSYTIDGAAPPAVALEAAITVTKDGPYAIAGAVELVGAQWAQGASRERYTLCRCGASKNKPFCDGSHYDAGFRDEGNARA
jgi:CDGSH-type Zn-finger protein